LGFQHLRRASRLAYFADVAPPSPGVKSGPRERPQDSPNILMRLDFFNFASHSPGQAIWSSRGKGCVQSRIRLRKTLTNR
jgi:hypothetical protein